MTDYQSIYNALQQLLRTGDEAGAKKLIAQKLDAAPDDLALHRIAGHMAVSLHQGQKAIAHFSRLTEAAVADADDFYAIGGAYMHLGHPGLARQAFQQCLTQNPKHVAAWCETGKCLAADNIHDKAVDAFRHALTLAPNDAETLMLLGNVLLMSADPEGGMAVLDKAVALQPDIPVLRSSALVCAQYQPGMTAKRLQALHRDATRAFHILSPHQLPPRPAHDRPLKIGFLSGNFRRHPAGHFLLPLARHMDGPGTDVHLFSVTPPAGQDDLTRRLQQGPMTWHDMAAMSLADMERYILKTDLDILVDIGGHRERNRFILMAKRLAPYQATWIESVGTTGVPNIDAVISDQHHIPPGEDDCYDEDILRLPQIYTAIEFPFAPQHPLSTKLPQERQGGQVTFGSISQPGKFNKAVAACWSRILHQVPGSRLLLKFGGLDQDLSIRNLHALFAAHDISPERLLLEGKSPYSDSMTCYDQRIDIALDPFPYSGGLTTLEAAWMGCPVLTMPGNTVAGRHAGAYLRNMGLDELVLDNEAAYIDKAVALARDPAALKVLRARMRPALQQSPMMLPGDFARDFTTVLRNAFDKKVAGDR